MKSLITHLSGSPSLSALAQLRRAPNFLYYIYKHISL